MRSRKRYWNRAINSFASQDYPNRELLIGIDGLGELPVIGERQYVEICPPLRSLGAKRNWLNTRSRGEWICHWDDDDWSDPRRISRQMEVATTPVCGLRTSLFWDERSGQAYQYRGAGEYVIGSSLLYRADYWRERQFEGLNVGEDNGFVSRARAQRRLTCMDDGLMVCTSHAGNTSQREYAKKQWQPVEKSEIPGAYFET
jgi:glycosyltransferase involved in cell wall biosynthesis